MAENKDNNKAQAAEQKAEAAAVASENKDVVVERKVEVEKKTEAEKKSDAEFKAMRDAQEKMNNEVMAAQAKLRPTPTPAEMLKALEGHNVDHKEDHGAPEQNVHHVPVSAAKQMEVDGKTGSGYATRETKKDE